THETSCLMPSLGSPAPSPDGKWVVFSINRPAYDEKESSSDLWLVPAEGGAEPRQITFSKSAESDVTWSPDSRRIAFSAKREGDEQNQIYLHDLLAGTKLVQEPGFGGRTAEGSRDEIDAAWSPDGQSIVFSVSTNRNVSAYAESGLDLYRIAVKGDATPELIAHGDASYTRPRFRPDCKSLYTIYNA